MADGVAFFIFVLILTACGLGPACNLKGPGIAYQIDGKAHYFKLGTQH